MRSSRRCISITICINYSDYLDYVIDNNISLFYKSYIITTKEDKETIKVVTKRLGTGRVELLYTDLVHKHKAIFNKAAMIRQAQKHIHKLYPKHWICLLDSDVQVPSIFRNINLGSLDRKGLYGMVRKILVDSHTNEEKTERIIGYFQLYYNKRRFYERNSYNASECDCYFNELFKDKQYYLHNPFDNKLLTCLHVGPTNVNWNGRVSKRLDKTDLLAVGV